jgi:hypothetical protein
MSSRFSQKHQTIEWHGVYTVIKIVYIIKRRFIYYRGEFINQWSEEKPYNGVDI